MFVLLYAILRRFHPQNVAAFHPDFGPPMESLLGRLDHRWPSPGMATSACSAACSSQVVSAEKSSFVEFFTIYNLPTLIDFMDCDTTYFLKHFPMYIKKWVSQTDQIFCLTCNDGLDRKALPRLSLCSSLMLSMLRMPTCGVSSKESCGSIIPFVPPCLWLC